MSDVRALLKAKRQEAKVNHPLASYSSSGQLRCIACGTIVKQAAAWNGHVGSKSHRTNVARLKQDDRAREATLAQQHAQTKRKASDDGDNDHEPESDPIEHTKRPKLDPSNQQQAHPSPPASSAFPADFFSDPSKAPPPQSPGDDSDDDQPIQSADTPIPANNTSSSQDVIDLEWKQFQQAMLNPPQTDDTHDTFQRATVFAEPVLNQDVPAGFPPRTEQPADAEPELDELDEDTLRKKKEQDERELIMDRLLEEERLQEEADAKVSMLKNKLELIKRKREAAKAAKAKKA